jgi:hypothetical protein
VSRQAHEKEPHDGRVRKPKPYEVGVQIPRHFHPEVLTEGAVRKVGAAPWRSVPDMQKESRIEERHLLADHVHMMIAIPPSSRCHR